MLAIVVSRAEEPRWRRTFAAGDVNIGHRPHNQLVLDGDSVDGQHARIWVNGGRISVADLGSASGTFVGGQRLAAPRVVGPRDRIAAGAYTLRALLVAPEPAGAYQSRAPLERELLDAIATGDDASRLVYADWLEGRGDHARAELLRLQHALDALPPGAPGFQRATDRLRELAAGVDTAWRARIAKRPIEGCPAFDYACPKRWSELAPTQLDGVRHCGACDQPVYYCASVEEAREHAARGACVALDVTSPRWEGDLAAPFHVYTCERCEIDAGPGRRTCPRCGDLLAGRATVRGRMVVR
ncbi:MAG TPA: FHA domain-containing protein [Kofleriaceae bacterium]|nr:FHA domain-containing protein [Kofleriaceae bacterium]